MELESQPSNPSRQAAPQSGRKVVTIGTVVSHNDGQTQVRVGEAGKVQSFPQHSSLPVGAEVKAYVNEAGQWVLTLLKGRASSLAESLFLKSNPQPLKWLGNYAAKGKEIQADQILFGRVLQQLEQVPSGEVGLGKVLVESGGRVFEALSEPLKPGSLFYFKLTMGPTLPEIHKMDSLKVPENLQSILGELKPLPAYTLAQETLLPWKGEAFFPQAVADFGRWLVEAGIVEEEGLSPAFGFPGTMKEGVEQLLQQFLKGVPPSSESIQSWLRLHQNPEWILKWLEGVSFQNAPEKHSINEAQILTLDSKIHFSPVHPLHSFTTKGPQTLLEILQQMNSMEKLERTGPEMKLHRQILEALSTELQLQKENMAEGTGVGFAWVKKKWGTFRWRHSRPEDGDKKNTEIGFYVETEGKNLGKVRVDMSLNKEGATLFFRDGGGKSEKILQDEIPLLEKNLAHLDLKIMSWKYGKLETPKGEAEPREGSQYGKPADAVGRGELDLLI